jgi:RimJ/RimL family protein N-acetyltransferase
MTSMPSIYGTSLYLTPFRLAGPELRFAINRRDNQRQVGILLITDLDLLSGHASLKLLISNPEKQAEYGPEALELALTFAFSERKLHRITVCIPEYDGAMLKLMEQSGFVLEARQRQAIFLRGRFWDDLLYGLLASDWQVKVQFETLPLPLEGPC